MPDNTGDRRPPRMLEEIDRDLDVERRLLEYEARNGRHTSSAVATWRHIDHLLDERLACAAPQPRDGPC